jgi:hypothetical protein
MTTLLERDPVAYFKRKARNVDKQRRRLLAERLERHADACADTAFALPASLPVTGWYFGHAEKLRTVAARLRNKS